MFGFIKKFKWLIFAVFLVGLIGIGFYFYYPRNLKNTETIENPKIAVLPFTNLSPNTETDFLGASFSDEIYKNLMLSSICQVIKGKELKPNENLNEKLAELRAKSNVDFVILGTYVVNENEIEITNRLVSTFDNKDVYRKLLTVKNSDISTIPALTSNAIIDGLNLKSAATVDFLITPENINAEAYRNYLKAAAIRRSDRNKAVELLQKAVQIEPKFYSAWTLLAGIYRSMASDGSNPSINYYEKAIEAANKAKEIDPNKPQAGTFLTTIYAEQGKLEEALKEYNNLPRNDLNRAERLRLGAYVARYGGLLDEAIKLSQESVKLTPKIQIFQPELYYNGDYEGFIKNTLDTKEPSFNSFFLSLTALYQGNKELMRKYFQDSRTFFQGQFIGKISQAFLLHLDGKTAEGLKLLQEAEKAPNEAKYFDGETLYFLVIAYAYLGNKEGAIRNFKKTVENGFFCYPYFARNPVMNNLRNEKRFQQILETARQKHLKFKEIYYAEIPSTP